MFTRLKVLFTLRLCLTFFFLFSFSRSFAATIAGRFSDFEQGQPIRAFYYSNPFNGREIAVEGKAEAEGKFSLTLSLSRPEMVTLETGLSSITFFLRPNDSLYITTDIYDFEGKLEYFGTNSYDNNYLIEELRNGYHYRTINPNNFVDTTSYRRHVDSVEAANVKFYLSFDTTRFSPEFRQYSTAELKYKYFNARFMFSVGYDISKHKFITRQLPETYFTFLRNMNLSDETALQTSSYRIALRRYLDVFVNDSLRLSITDTTDQEKFRKEFIRIKSAFFVKRFKGKVRDYLLTQLMWDHIADFSADRKFGDQMISYFKQHCEEADYRSLVEKQYRDSYRLDSGQPAPDFVLTEPNGKRVSLSSLKGKYVFIDFWASWCTPCLAAFPKSQKLIDDPRFEKLQVVYVNYRDFEGSWRSYLTKNPMKGLHLFADKKESQMLEELYEINMIPRYVLIDPSGKIINSAFRLVDDESLLKSIR